ncbi:MAG: septal ring lytic transglycosylase RlpA family protein [Desulfovibrio sp.]|nr:septal ring lytic transglycosylase RlpA family protein [Desulfovibrio sp.]
MQKFLSLLMRRLNATACEAWRPRGTQLPASPHRRRLGLATLSLLYLLMLILCQSSCSLRGSVTDPGKTASGGAGSRGSKPYTIQGKTYYPLLSAKGFREEGIASWYGPNFHGKKTANGERYDMYGMTAAHKILPFGTKVRVTNRSNGRSIVVRINDRGPFVTDRIIDLTRTGAEEIGMLAKGTAPVVLESVGTVKGLEDGRFKGRFYVQVGAFGSRSNADRLLAECKRQGRDGRVWFADHASLWRVQVGPYSGLNEAEAAAAILQETYPGNFVVAE